MGQPWQELRSWWAAEPTWFRGLLILVALVTVGAVGAIVVLWTSASGLSDTSDITGGVLPQIAVAFTEETLSCRTDVGCFFLGSGLMMRLLGLAFVMYLVAFLLGYEATTFREDRKVGRGVARVHLLLAILAATMSFLAGAIGARTTLVFDYLVVTIALFSMWLFPAGLPFEGSALLETRDDKLDR